jgi:hypothetical protein
MRANSRISCSRKTNAGTLVDADIDRNKIPEIEMGGKVSAKL